MSKDVTIISSTRYYRTKFTIGAKLTLSAFSIMGFIGGWNMIGRMEKQLNRTVEPPLSPSPWPTPMSITIAPTPWPTIQPLTELPPIPTLVSTFTTTVDPSVQSETQLDTSTSNSVQFASIPTLAPLPTLEPLPTIPPTPLPPPPPPPISAGGGNSSGGS